MEFDAKRAEQVVYIVIDHRQIVVEVQKERIDAVIMSLRQSDKELCIPGTDVLFCFSPRLGIVNDHCAIIPSVIFWQGKFWVPFLDTVPSRQQIAHDLQLAGAVFATDGSNIDIIYEVNKVAAPELNWELFNH